MIKESITEMVKRTLKSRELNLLNDFQFINQLEISIQTYEDRLCKLCRVELTDGLGFMVCTQKKCKNYMKEIY